jgi:hypothetical protein
VSWGNKIPPKLKALLLNTGILNFGKKKRYQKL